jgi:hypothetical protein
MDCFVWWLVACQRSYIHRRGGIVLADDVGAAIEKRAVSRAILSGGEIVDVTGMPARSGRSLRIGVSAIIIDPRDDTMVAVFETTCH